MNKLQELKESLTYGNGNVIAKNDNYVLVKPLNTYDTNYKLCDIESNSIYLIDSEEVQYKHDDLEEYGGILYTDMINLNIELIKDASWKILDNIK